MPRHQIIALNGPPGSGKDTLAKLLRKRLTASRVDIIQCAGPMKQAASTVTGLPLRYFEDQELKNSHNSRIGMTPRKFLILFSESFLKPTLGQDTNARRLYRSVLDANKEHQRNVVVTDVGFMEEYDYLVKAARLTNMDLKLIRLHRGTFKNDSRGYIHPKIGDIFDLRNEHQTVSETKAELFRMLALN